MSWSGPPKVEDPKKADAEKEEEKKPEKDEKEPDKVPELDLDDAYKRLARALIADRPRLRVAAAQLTWMGDLDRFSHSSIQENSLIISNLVLENVFTQLVMGKEPMTSYCRWT